MYIGESAALMTAITWAISAFLFASATILIGSATVNITRLFISMLLLIITVLILGIPLKMSLYQIIMLSLSGIFGLAISDTFYFKSLEYLSARISTLISAFSPGITAILAYLFLSEGLSLMIIIGMIITLIGISMVVLEPSHEPETPHSKKEARKGLILISFAIIWMAIALIFVKSAYKDGEIDSIAATLVRVVSAMVFILPMIIIMKEFKNPYKVFQSNKKALKITLWATILGSYLGTVFMFISVTQTSVAIASTIIATRPILQLPIAHYYYKEKITWRAIFGTILAVIGVVVLFVL